MDIHGNEGPHLLKLERYAAQSLSNRLRYMHVEVKGPEQICGGGKWTDSVGSSLFKPRRVLFLFVFVSVRVVSAEIRLNNVNTSGRNENESMRVRAQGCIARMARGNGVTGVFLSSLLRHLSLLLHTCTKAVVFAFERLLG